MSSSTRRETVERVIPVAAARRARETGELAKMVSLARARLCSRRDDCRAAPASPLDRVRGACVGSGATLRSGLVLTA
ncbi:hypothetical protein GCM10022262_15590 [Georgenia daeguensis]|uniref:Uncharacterized protein n=1 Tax=Georgenia daeguensis TaxID=908355 RepID=A0ABP8ETF7_9MICO